MECWLLFWQATIGALSDAEVAARLRRGDSSCVVPSNRLGEFRRDVIASDPAWISLRLLPRPDSAEPVDRYVALVFATAPAAEQVRDLRYVAVRNGLTGFHSVQGDAGELSSASCAGQA
ncbi:MAG: hypothetical protein QOE23_2018 [Pseudonocardiales bacterium]|nr:hypothetical protein [Pseudonocardiales bacterium]